MILIFQKAFHSDPEKYSAEWNEISVLKVLYFENSLEYSQRLETKMANYARKIQNLIQIKLSICFVVSRKRNDKTNRPDRPDVLILNFFLPRTNLAPLNCNWQTNK